MPRKPRFNHPVRQVRTCLGHSQNSFAKLIGCSAIAIQRIENGTLELSRKLANSIFEATAAEPVSLMAGHDAKALDVFGKEYTKETLQFFKKLLPCDGAELKTLLMAIFHQLELLYLVSNRGSKYKTYAVNEALQRAVAKIADDFDLTKSINNFLIENGHVMKRTYRVSDLRKFSDYARIIGYQDNKRFKPEKLVSFKIPHGWLVEYYLHEKAILPHGADRKLRDANYILDSERPVPPHVKEAMDQALYWEIVEFRSDHTSKPVR
jgi:DNA-binding XRE family transcriptional regulator